MNFAREYKSFINSQQLYEGIRVASGILIPALLMGYFDMLTNGILLSLGAMCASIADSPGPMLHRRNAMLACIVSIFIVAMAIGFAVQNTVVLAIVIFVFCFSFSMLNIYGARAGAIGIASLLILVLNLERHIQGWDVIWRACYIASGGLWYMCYSILLHNVRPYKLVQQALGDCIESIAVYLRTRAEFYRRGINYDDVYRQLLQQQALVQEKQTMVAEMLFKTRSIVKESTPTGRVLVMIYLDIADMLERIMTSYQLYKTLHDYFDEVDILDDYRAIALLLANDIEEVGIAVKAGASSLPNTAIAKRIKEARQKLEVLRATFMKPENMEGFINLRRIIENIEDIYSRLQTLHKYTTYDHSLTKKDIHKIDFDKYISHQVITPEMFVDNLTLQSENFRHSLRVSIAVMVGFIGSLFFPLGHSYWILLTIIVILKPAYSLTRSRNIDRLLGTGFGLVIGVGVIYFIHSKTALLVIMIFLMVGTYVFLRMHYLVSVIFMTPYVIIFFHLLNPAIFREVIADRLIDTAIGSAIAFAASNFLFPAWERDKIRPALLNMLTRAVEYFKVVACGTEAQDDAVNKQKVSRKDALVELANLSATFNRMLSEPRSKQEGIEDIHRFVVLCHMLMSHIATLSLFSKSEQDAAILNSVKKLAALLQQYIQAAINQLKGEEINDDVTPIKDYLREINEASNLLLEQRRQELQGGLSDTETRQKLSTVKSMADQYNFIFNIATDIRKTAKTLAGVI